MLDGADELLFLQANLDASEDQYKETQSKHIFSYFSMITVKSDVL